MDARSRGTDPRRGAVRAAGRPPRRPAALLLLAVLAAALGLGGLAAPAATAAAPASRTTPTPAPADTDELPVRVEITQVAPTVLRPGEDLVVTARLTNTSPDPVVDPRVLVHLERIRPGTRDDLQHWLDEPLTGRRIGDRVAQVTSEGPLAPGASVDVTVTVAAGNVGLLDRPDTWGARGLAVQVLSSGSRVGLQRSFALWATESDDVPQARVSLLVPVVGPAPVPDGIELTAPGPTLTEMVQPGRRLDAALEVARSSADVAIVVDPAVVDAARTGTSLTAAWADELTSVAVGRDVVALPWSDPDLTALAHADALDLLDAATDATVAATTAAVDGGRRLSARTDVLWAPGPLTDRVTVDLAARSGASALVMAPADLPADADESGARTELASTSGTVLGLVPDPTLTTLLTDPQQLVPDATDATVVQRVLAELSVLARGSEQGLQHVLVALPRDTVADPERITAVLAGIQAAPWSRTAPLTALLGASGADEQRGTLPTTLTDPDALAPAEIERLTAARRAAVAFAAVTDDPERILVGVDAQTVAPVSTAWRADPAGRARLVDAVVAAVDGRRSGLTLARTSAQYFVSADNTVRFSVRNELSADAQVRVQTTPRKACLRTEPSDPVLVRAGSEELVTVSMHAIANCEVVVEAVLTGVDGVPLAEPVTFDVRATPTIESVGTAVVGVLLAVGLVLGVVRTVRRGQSARRGARRVDDEAGTRPLPVLGGTPEGDSR